MLAEYPIIMKQKNNQGDYDTLYPKTLGSQVQGMTLDQVSGNLDSSRIEGNIPSSQIEGTFPSSSITGQFPASQINYNNSQTSTIITSNQVQGAIDELFMSVSNGKAQIASAITDKGVSTSASDSFTQMATNINNISTGFLVTSQEFTRDFNTGDWTITVKPGYKLWENLFVSINSIGMQWDANMDNINASNWNISLTGDSLKIPGIMGYGLHARNYVYIGVIECTVYYVDPA